jgi:hypothetical protein
MEEPSGSGGSGGRRCFPGLLQETAAAVVPSNSDGKRDGAILKETGAGGLIVPQDSLVKKMYTKVYGATLNHLINL